MNRELEQLREVILDSLRKDIKGDKIEVSVMADAEQSARLLGLFRSGQALHMQRGTTDLGNTKFMVGVSKIGGADVIG